MTLELKQKNHFAIGASFIPLVDLRRSSIVDGACRDYKNFDSISLLSDSNFYMYDLTSNY